MRCSNKSRKLPEVRDGGSLDRISSLPDALLGHILSFLSTLNAAQTSIMSTRWRYLFTLTSNLSFDGNEYFDIHKRSKMPGPRECKSLKMSFERFVYGMLALHRKSPIQKFSLKLERTNNYDWSDILIWISAAVLKGVQHLELHLSEDIYTLPHCICNSQTIVILEIVSPLCPSFLKVPGLVCLPNLSTLILSRLNLAGESLNRFLIGCSQLKELTLHRCHYYGDNVCISAGALQKLTVSSGLGHVEIDAPHLVNLSYMGSSCADVDVTSSLKKSCSLLEYVHLSDSSPDMWKYVTFWLANSFQLKTIIFREGLILDHAMGEWPPSIVLAPFSSNVKTIEVHYFQGTKLELLLLKYLLENAGALKRLIIYKHSMTMEEELQTCKELLLLPKASTYCTIELK